jgi:hypothetical protein
MAYIILSALAEAPWVFLFLLLMGLVEIQLMYCIPCLRGTAKIVEAGIVVVLLRLWLDPGFVSVEPWAATLRDAIANHTLG